MLYSNEDLNLKELDNPEKARQVLQVELESAKRVYQEIGRKIDQSQIEVDKLAKRNASITSNLQQVQNQESIPRSDIIGAYDAALDALRRLVVMRGQMEKLQQQRESIERYISVLDGVQHIFELNGGSGSKDGGFSMVEMMIQGQEAERQRLSRQMHDGPAQALSNFILQAEIATRLFDIDQAKAREELQSIKTSATTTFEQVRDFIFQLRPMMLDDLGLIPTIKRYVEAVKGQTSIDIDVVVTGNERRLEPYIEVVVFRSFQELLNNALNHSQSINVKVFLDVPDNEVRLSVEDVGTGFVLTEVFGSDKHVGLKLIKERAELLGGIFEVDSSSEGSRISLRLPLKASASS